MTQSLIFNYFATKDDLIEAVYERVYLHRLDAGWAARLADRSVPLRDRLTAFYGEYSSLIFRDEWMRIFMFSGLAGATLNRRYLEHLGSVILYPLVAEFKHASPTDSTITMEDIWNLHGGIVYIGIRRHIYRMPCPDDSSSAISKAVDRFLG